MKTAKKKIVVVVESEASGTAPIMVDAKGQNVISVLFRRELGL